MSLWCVIPDAAKCAPDFVPSPPRGSWTLAVGTLRAPALPEYPRTVAALRGLLLLAVVQDTLDPVWGLRVWMPERDGRWYLQTTHVQNTLLDDPDFRAVIGITEDPDA